MNRLTHFISNQPQPMRVFALVVSVFATYPLLILIKNWVNPACDSLGLWSFLLAVLLFLWSITSPLKTDALLGKTQGFFLLLATSLLHFISQFMAGNSIGALALTADVYALGLLTELRFRQRAISPFGLALVFAFNLPSTNGLQKAIGYLLQHLSALGTTGWLGIFYRVHVEGIRILLCGQNILLDSPSSGVQLVSWLLLLFTLLIAIKRPSIDQVVAGLLYTLFWAFLMNTVRISILSVGVAFPNLFLHRNVMAQPWHDLIGFSVFLLFGLLPLLGMFFRFQAKLAERLPIQQEEIPESALITGSHWSRLKIWLGCFFVACVLALLSLPSSPMAACLEPVKPTPSVFSIHLTEGKFHAFKFKQHNFWNEGTTSHLSALAWR